MRPALYKQIGPAKGVGKGRRKSIEACQKRIVDTDDYFIRRHGGWFREGAHGYTDDIAAAGIFSAEDARKYIDVEGLSVVPFKSARDYIWRQSCDALARAAKLSSLAIR